MLKIKISEEENSEKKSEVSEISDVSKFSTWPIKLFTRSHKCIALLLIQNIIR